MSRNAQSQSKNQSKNSFANAQKPFCGVCQKAGKSIDVYTSHYTKSNLGPSGVVICPTILTAICSYCKQGGHFKSACNVLKEKERTMRAAAHESARENYKKEEKKQVKTIFKNSFAAAFEDDSSDDEGVEENKKEIKNKLEMDFPALSTKIVETKIDNKPSYASMAIKPAQPTITKQAISEMSLADYVISKPIQCKSSAHSWADDSYWSDDE
jgi:hypothetical protein